jgi:oxygen-independent coproporphyrinogen-3 oxidase
MVGANSNGSNSHRVEAAHAYIEKQRLRRQSNKVLHAHPSPLFWSEREIPVKKVMIGRHTTHPRIPKRINLYVATPYCLPTNPDRCGFCLFPSEIFMGQHQLERYLQYLEIEGRRYQDFFEGDELASIYFGGGTSNLYRPDVYPKLLEIVRGVFPTIPSSIEITLEGIPQLFTREKLEAMKAAGFNRISMGVQQLDDEMIKLSGRKQKAKHVFQTLEWCHELGLRSSVDLIFGWPRQTVQHMLNDLDAIVRTGVRHITHYELNVAGRTDFARNHRDELPSIEQNLEMFRVAKEFLEGHGYRQATTYDWEKADDAATPGNPQRDQSSEYQYEDQMRKFFTHDETKGTVGYDMWGWGYAGVSYFFGTPESPGWVYMNATRVNDYFAALDESRFPIERGFHYEQKDLRLTWLFQSLQAMEADAKAYKSIFGVDLLHEYEPIWQALSERGWAEISPEKATLIGDGVFYTPLIQGLLSHDRMEEIRRSRSGGSAVLEAEPAPQRAPSTTVPADISQALNGTLIAKSAGSIAAQPLAVPLIDTRADRLFEEEMFLETTQDGVGLALHRVRGEIRHDPPLIFTHGTFSDAQVCRLLARYLAREGFDSWILELRGHGHSQSGSVHPDFERFSMFDVPTALDAVRRRTRRENLFWVAHSGGGLVLLMHLARYPEACAQIRGIVTLATQATDAGASWAGRMKIALGALATNALGRAPGKMLRLGPQDEFRGVMNQWFGWNWTGRWVGKDGFDYLQALERIEVPALCFAGGGDRFIAPHQGCRRLYNALGSLDKRFAFCAKSEGYAEDYSHARIIASRRAQQEIWPVIAEWLIKRA